MKEEDNYEINLRRFKHHERKFPWALIRKILIAVVLVSLLYYLNKTLSDLEPESIEEFEVEVDSVASSALEASPDL